MYFLQITNSYTCKTKQIALIDIDFLEPLARHRFRLSYYYKASKLFQGIRTEHYDSKHIAEIVDVYQQIMEEIEGDMDDIGSEERENGRDDTEERKARDKPKSLVEKMLK